MKKILFLITLLCILFANATASKRIIRFPSFEYSQTPEFKIDSICITNKETLVYFHYDNRGNISEWINIDADTYIKDAKGKKYRIKSLENISKEPKRTYIVDKKEWVGIIHFPQIKSNTIDFIEDESQISFNIYGIDLAKDGEFAGYVDFVDLNRKLDIADFYFTAGNYNKYIELATPLLIPLKSSLGKIGSINVLEKLIDSYVLSNNKNDIYKAHIAELRELYKNKNFAKDLNCSIDLFAELLQTKIQVDELILQNKTEEACPLLAEFLPKAELVYNENDTTIAFYESVYSSMLEKSGNYEEAMQWGQKSLDNYKRANNIGANYQSTLIGMAVRYDELYDVEKAHNYYQELYNLQEQIGNKYTFEHAQIGFLWGHMLLNNKNKKCIHILRDAYELYDSPKMVIDSLYQVITNALSIGYREIDDNIPESIKIWEHAAQNIRGRLGKNSALYFNTIVGLAERCRETRNIGKASEYIYELNKELQSQKFTIEHIKGLTTFANILRDIGDNNQAIEVYKQINNIYESNHLPHDFDYAYLLLDMSCAYENAKDTINCINTCTTIINSTFKSTYREWNPNEVKLLAKVTLQEIYKNVNPAYSANLCEEIFLSEDCDSDYKAIITFQLKYLYAMYPNNTEVRKVYDRIFANNDISLNKNEFINPIDDLLEFIQEMNDIEHNENNIQDYTHLIHTDLLRKNFEEFREKLLNNFLFLTEDQRENYYNSEIKKVVNPMMLAIVSDISKIEELNGIIYDYLLLTKSILLESATGINEIVYKSNDKGLIKLYEKVKNSYDGGDKTTRKLYKREILARIRTISNFTSNLQVNWRDVKKVLKDNEVALEFLYDNKGKASLYGVLILRNNYDYPKYRDLSAIEYAIELFGFERMANIWYFLLNEDYVHIGDKVFLSSAGILHTKHFENIEMGHGMYFSDICNVVRVTSTREIVKQRSNTRATIGPIMLFGNLDYNTNEKVVTNKDYNSQMFRGKGEERYRAGFEKLTYSQIEIDSIQNIAKNNKIKCKKYCGKIGTEQEVRNMSGKNIGIIHFATHGIYYPESRSTVEMINPYQQLFNKNNCLNRSFLVMAGGNALPQHKSVSNSSVDGLLTADEISRIDFSNVNLVVLSACQSAQGDLSNEGVLGLQYGFKKAGVKSILMCLANIDDRATQILMVEFYKNLLSGKSKHDSLRDAQRFLRATENGKYSDPKYWASFILLDAID